MNKVTTIRNSLEKIRKAILIKIENGDDLSVSSELVWYDDLIDRIYLLLETNEKLFFDLVDPNSRFKYVPPLNVNAIDWSKVKLRESTKSNHLKSYPISVTEAEFDILDSFFSFGIHVWEAGIKSENIGHARRGLYIIGNLYGIISTLPNNQKIFNATPYFDFFCQKLWSKLHGLLSAKKYTQENDSLISYFAFHFNLDHLSSDRLHRANIEFIFRSLFRNLKALVTQNQAEFLKAFVRSASHRNLLPMIPSANNHLTMMAFEKINNDSQRTALDIKIYKRTVTDPHNLFGIGDLADVERGLDELLRELELVLVPLSQEETIHIESYIAEVKDFALKKFKYRQVQRALNYTLIFCIFQNKFEPIDYAFQFHNPSDNTARWANDDIILADLAEILRFADHNWETESSLMFDWPDHHGTMLYIDIYVVALLYRWMMSRSIDESVANGVDRFIRQSGKTKDQITLCVIVRT